MREEFRLRILAHQRLAEGDEYETPDEDETSEEEEEENWSDGETTESSGPSLDDGKL